LLSSPYFSFEKRLMADKVSVKKPQALKTRTATCAALWHCGGDNQGILHSEPCPLKILVPTVEVLAMDSRKT